MDRISRNPEQYPSHDLGTRQMVLPRFPFVIVFRAGAAGVEIIAIAHGRRRLATGATASDDSGAFMGVIGRR
jgi:hypothetical protein